MLKCLNSQYQLIIPHFQEDKNYHLLSDEDIMTRNVFKSKSKIKDIGATTMKHWLEEE
ncbi:MAG: hypothetical protein GY775_05055 [Candidatus Scalindua sp.]|nr:hypothetical protein [Candidatus Scalindua sp.]